MKYTISGFSQQEALQFKKIVSDKSGKEKEIKVDCTDLLILRWFVDFYPKMTKVEIDGSQYAWVQYQKILQDLPLLDIKKQALFDRFQKMCEFEILTHRIIKAGGSFSYYGFGKMYSALIDTESSQISKGEYSTNEGVSSQIHKVEYSTNEQINKSIKDKSINDNKKERKTSYDKILSGIEESNNTQKQQVAKARSGEEETNALKEKIKCLEKEIEILKNNNNIKERKKEEPKKKATSYDEILSGIADEELKTLYLEYIKMRKLIKAPMTDRALQMLISKVNTLEPDSIDNQKELLETAIMNNWKSVYPIKKGAKDSEQSDYGNNKRNGDEYSFLG